jgi:endonuclease/exonuclease/phosphatase family metal-dependent hydrolase
MNLFFCGRWFIYLSMVALVLCGFCSCKENIRSGGPTSSQSVTVMTYNIRNANPGHNLKYWNQRKKRLANEVVFYDPDFMGIQEGLYTQVQYLSSHLTGRKYIGVGRKDGKRKGEFEAIYYNTNRFSLVDGTDSTMWLSATPNTPSKGWGAPLPRVITWGKFRSKVTGKELYVFNTHFALTKKARVNSAKLILKTVKKIAGDTPVVLTGDFNVTEQQKAYKILKDSFLRDARHISKLKPIGPEFSYAGGFKVCDSSAHRALLDHIFVNKYLNVSKIAVISNFRNSRFLSDHLPVYSELLFKQ